MATTFINTKQNEETILLDLKHLLREAKQRVPHFLLALEDPLEALVGQGDVLGCGWVDTSANVLWVSIDGHAYLDCKFVLLGCQFII